MALKIKICHLEENGSGLVCLLLEKHFLKIVPAATFRQARNDKILKNPFHPEERRTIFCDNKKIWLFGKYRIRTMFSNYASPAERPGRGFRL